MRYFNYLYKTQAKKVFFQALRLAKKQKNLFSQATSSLVKTTLENFQNRIISQNPPIDKTALNDFRLFKKQHLDLKGVKKWIHFTYTTIFALAIALIIRQMWFELYKVPTGSMRPTIKELDHLTVSKLNFSLNIPFTPKHFYFDPTLVKRSSICVFTSENMDVTDSDTRYFYIIPGKKLLVKRLIAKPGDVIYFYGGKIYGIDASGNDITSELNPSNIPLIDHIPFIQWLGEKEITFTNRKGTIYHMNAPYAEFDALGNWSSTIPNNLKAVESKQFQNINAAWGLDNFATTRILNGQIKQKLYPQDMSSSSNNLFLELKHSLQPVKMISKDQSLPLKLEASLLPLDNAMAKKLFGMLYTARFEVLNGALKRYGSQMSFSSKQLPKLHHIPDGTYEFYYGKAYKVLFGGITQELDKSHPIYRFSQTALEVFFNLGIEFNTYFSPGIHEHWAPQRYSYFRDGDLYVMGLPFLKEADGALAQFVSLEKQKQNPFIDHGSPMGLNGLLNKNIIKQYGLKIPDNMYFVLGDNHAQSADSRVFGFVPQDNLKGSPIVIFWPFGPRFGHLPQAMQILLTLPRSIIWSTAWIIGIVWIRYRKRRDVFPQKIDL